MRLNLTKFTLLGCACAVSAFAQLTVDQRIADFQQLVGLYVKNYGPYEWKRDALKFDLFKTAPWIDRIKAAKDDLDFYEVMVDYVASLNDAHDTYTLSSTFVASLGFSADIYDGKALVDSISRTRLPAGAASSALRNRSVGTGQRWPRASTKISWEAMPPHTPRAGRNPSLTFGR